MAFKINSYSLTSSEARIQVPWVKVTFKSKQSEYTFGIFTSQTMAQYKGNDGFWYRNVYGVRYPNYIESLSVVKINGQVNQYTLNITYPITQNDDPNFFEKIFSGVSETRKIIFTYGDAATPAFVYKDEEAIITTITQTFNLENSCIKYTINAVSGAALNTPACLTFEEDEEKPSVVIKKVLHEYGLNKVFTGMNERNWYKLVVGTDDKVKLAAKVNISALDYIKYLVSCMRPVGQANTTDPQSIYLFTIHDTSSYDKFYTYNSNFGEVRNTSIEDKNLVINGPYFKISEVSYNMEKSDAFVLDIGYNNSTIVRQFSIENNENYAIYYKHQLETASDTYVRHINDNGIWEDIYAPPISSKNDEFLTRPEDQTWWTKVTQFPINATVTVQGLLRPARLLTYIRLNVVFPGGHQHISSGLYIVTKQVDTINANGYTTILNMTRVGGTLLKKD